MKVRTTQNDTNNRDDKQLIERLRSLWLGMKDSTPPTTLLRPTALNCGQVHLRF